MSVSGAKSWTALAPLCMGFSLVSTKGTKVDDPIAQRAGGQSAQPSCIPCLETDAQSRKERVCKA